MSEQPVTAEDIQVDFENRGGCARLKVTVGGSSLELVVGPEHDLGIADFLVQVLPGAMEAVLERLEEDQSGE